MSKWSRIRSRDFLVHGHEALACQSALSHDHDLLLVPPVRDRWVVYFAFEAWKRRVFQIGFSYLSSIALPGPDAVRHTSFRDSTLL
jgi:hypothetical protein